MTIRSVRNNNPGNINAGQPWQGLMPKDRMTREQANEDRFAVFSMPEWGFRAMAVVLRNYARMYGVSSVRDVIRRWAPPFENNTDTYTKIVAKALGVTPDAKINLLDRSTMFVVCKAIATHETGAWGGCWTDAQLDAGLSLAGY